MTCTTPEKVGPICTTSCGSFVVAGGASGTCYMWALDTGALVRVWKAHYLAVSCVRVLDDDSYVVTTSEDAIVRVWNTGDLLDSSVSSPRASMSFSDHTLAITDLWTGGFGVAARILTCSLDQTLKSWFLHSSDPSEERSYLLRSVVLPCPLNCCTADGLETFAFVAGTDGVIYEVPLREGLRGVSDGGVSLGGGSEGEQARKRRRATGGGAVSGTSTFGLGGQATAASFRRRLEGHTAAVTCLSMSATGLLLVSGSSDGTCRLWDTYSGQAIKVVSIHGGLRPVVSLRVVPMPRDLARGHGATSVTSGGASERATTIPPLRPLHRYQTDPSAKGDGSADTGPVVRFRPYGVKPLLAMTHETLLSFVKGEGNSVASASQSDGFISLAPAVSDSRASGKALRAEHSESRLQDLDRENARWQRVNSKLYSIAVDGFLSGISRE